MDGECTICHVRYSKHRLSYGTVFSLYCVGAVTVPVLLGPTYDIAEAELERRCGKPIAGELWERFGPIKIEHRIFFLAGAKHNPGPECAACPRGWPVKCREHGGCSGSLHATLSNRRSKKVYSRRSDLPLEEVRNAYRNLLNGRLELPLSTPFVVQAECDHCCSRASLQEIQTALVQAVDPKRSLSR